MAFLSDPRFIRAMRWLFWLALIFACVMAVLPKPPGTPIDSFGDKAAHMLAFATLTGLAALTYPPEWRWKIAIRLSLLGAAIEFVQAIPILQRDSDFRDWVADSAAILVVTILAALILPRLRGEAADTDAGEAAGAG